MRLVLVFLLLAPLARANQADEAQRLLDAGIALFQAERLTEARAMFARAQERVPSRANPYRWLGVTDARLGRCPEAVAELSRFLSMARPDDPRAVDAAAVRERCRREIPPLVAAPPPAAPPSAAPPSAAPPSAALVAVEKPAPRPLTRRPWFIAVLSVTAAAVVAGVALGVAYGVPNDAAVPSTSLGSARLGFQ